MIEQTRFWSKLVDGDASALVTGKKAVRQVVPFARVPAVRLTGPNVGDRIAVVAYYFPFAVGIEVRVQLTQMATVDDVVARTFALHDGPITVTRDGQPPTDTALRDFALDLLERLATEIVPAPAEVTLKSDPFTVVTIVDAPGVAYDPNERPPSDAERRLFAMAAWTDRWAIAQLPQNPSPWLPLTNHAASDVIYAQRRGRVVWYPPYFTGDISSARGLAYRHRCLAALVMEVEALAAFLVLTNDVSAATPLPAAHEDWARFAGRFIGRLYGQPTSNALSTFQSSSVPRHLDDNGYTAPISAIRTTLGDTSLHA